MMHQHPSREWGRPELPLSTGEDTAGRQEEGPHRGTELAGSLLLAWPASGTTRVKATS